MRENSHAPDNSAEPERYGGVTATDQRQIGGGSAADGQQESQMGEQTTADRREPSIQDRYTALLDQQGMSAEKERADAKLESKNLEDEAKAGGETNRIRDQLQAEQNRGAGAEKGQRELQGPEP